MRTSLALASLLVAVIVQVTVLNGLLLPWGGTPDLVLVLVCALAMATGPVNGMLIGFAGGLCLDLAPPGSELVGQYALVFCLAGWAAGRLHPVAGHTERHAAGLVATGLLALVVAGAEVLSVGVVKVLTPAAISLREQLRFVLPATIAYDLVLCPFVLSAVMLASTMLAQRPATVGLTRALAGTTQSRRAVRRSARSPQLHLARNTRPAGLSAAVPSQWSRLRLRPAAGVPGSASGLRYERTRPSAPVHLRLAGGRRGDGVVGAGLSGPWGSTAGAGRHPGLLATSSGAFRPHVDRPKVPAQRRPVPISFAGHRGDGSFGHALAARRPAPVRTPAISFAGHRGDGSVGQTLAGGRPVTVGPQRSVIHFDSHPALSSRPQTVAPRLRFASNSVLVQKRAPASPRFRRGSAAIVPGGVLSDATLRVRRQQAAPRLRLSRASPGMLGGSGRSMLARPPGRARKQPRFSYGKRSPLSVLTGRRVGRTVGGRWLARQRAGSRAGVWLLGRRTGGLR